ncbi:MAG: membrane protein insertion efficiency factor YidD [Bacteroidales bacterium]|nr:membrane protein insertion efficiency factor YidD [Bacteroidales bacterium]MBN2756871.1 membrane protein insertion efficiency factor YidD [Bacteroidales bacterium]
MKKNLLLFFLFIFVNKICAQTQNDIKLFENIYSTYQEKVHYNNFKDSQNEIEQITGVFFSFYKKILSSQDANHCVFYPSCSEYTFQSIKKNGVIGIIDGIDRLSRCNRLSPENYKLYKNTNLFYDPVD